VGAFREIGYGGCFFLSAVIGGLLGLGFLVPAIRGGDHESQMWEDVRAIIVGVISGSAAWLVFKYTRLRPPTS
jgi:hypothetical protein